jgi:eukaryotic-like serine/threonine-protein kinase
MNNQGKELYEFGPFRLDAGKRLLLRDNQPVSLQLKAFETLLVLVRQSGQVVLKDDLMKSVWPDTFVEESNLAQNIFVLRKTLGDRAEQHRYIATVPGRGYRFVAKVGLVNQEDCLIVQSHELSKVVIERSRPRRTRAISVLAVALFIALGMAFFFRYHDLRTQRQPAAAAPLAIGPRRSVAVLGFQNLSGRNDPAWLSTAFSEMLTTELGAGNQLRTVSSEEIAQWKSSSLNLGGGTLSRNTLAQIRQTLGADVVVLGSYSDLGKDSRGQIRLDIQLQDTASGETFAAISETGSESELFQLVSRAGARLREKMAVPEISEVQLAAVQASRPSNTEAARLYALGLEKLQHFDALAARDYLDQAIRADSTYAMAHSTLAEAWSKLGYEAKAKAAAQKSFELSDKLPRRDRLFVEARYRGMNNEWGKAIELYHTLVDFFPDDIEYGLRLADAQTQAGKRNDALATIASLRKLAPPVRDDARIDLAEEMNYIRLGQYASGRNVAVRAVAKTRAGGFDLLLARALYLESACLAPLGEGENAIAAAEEAKKIYDRVGDRWGVSNALEYLAYVHSMRGESKEAERIYEQALAVNRRIGSKTGEAIDLNSIAAQRGARGDVKGEKKLNEQALAIYREIGDRNREAWALLGIAWAVDAGGDPATSLGMDDQALTIFTEMSDDQGAAYALTEKTSRLTMLGELGKAKEVCQHALALSQKSGNKPIMVTDTFYLGNIAKLEGNLDEAQKTFTEAISLAREAGGSATSAMLEQGLAEVAVEQNHQEEAKLRINALLSSLRDHKDPADEIAAESLLARIAVEEGDTTGANRAVAAARPLLRQSQGWESRILFGIADARVQAAVGRPAEAKQSLQTMIVETAKHGYVRYELEARLAFCEVEAKTDSVAARAHAKILEEQASSKGFGLIARKALTIAA